MQLLKAGVASLDVVTRATLATLALASGIYTYLGVRSLLDGTATLVFFAAVVYAVAVSVGIYAFWSFLMRLLPHVRTVTARLTLLVAMALGSLMIVAMSSWLNAAALAGSAALEQHLAVTLEGYSADLEEAHADALAAQSLLPDVRLASSRFRRLADAENADGALTGASGSGSVVQLLTQMSDQLDELASSIERGGEAVEALFTEGGEHLATMRGLVTASGPVAPRSDAFAREAVALAGVIAALEQTSVAPAVRRAADDLSTGFVAPVADGSTADLAGRQDRVIRNVEGAVAAQSAALSAAADEILGQPPVEPRRFVALSTPEAVLRYARDFLPSWAGAISIDLLPAVLILILSAVHAAIRAEDAAAPDAERMSASEMMRAVALLNEMDAARVRGDGAWDGAWDGRWEEDAPANDEPVAEPVAAPAAAPVAAPVVTPASYPEPPARPEVAPLRSVEGTAREAG